MLTAVARAIHLEEPPPWIFDDPFAVELAGDEGKALRELLRTELPEPNLLAFSRWVCVRARFSKDIVEDAVGNGICQYVILGAGLDSSPTAGAISSTGYGSSRLTNPSRSRGSGVGLLKSASKARRTLFSPRWIRA